MAISETLAFGRASYAAGAEVGYLRRPNHQDCKQDRAYMWLDERGIRLFFIGIADLI